MARNNNAQVEWDKGWQICHRCPLARCISGCQPVNVILRRVIEPECPLELAIWQKVPLSLAAQIAVNVTCGDTIHLDYYRQSIAGAANGMKPFFEELFAE